MSTADVRDFHPDLRTVARFLPRDVIGPRTVGIIRRLTAAGGRWRASRDVEVLTLASGVRVRLFRPAGKAAPGPALLWIHGGGYVTGTAAQDDPVCRQYVRQLGVTVASVEYRLAPEYPYPAALEDCYSALTWLAGLPSIDPARVAIAGGSAGGGLAAALGLTARDRGEVSLAAQILVYPMLDDRTVGDGLDDPRHRLWTQKSNRFGWAAYLGGADPQTAVPARHADLAGLPPTWLGVGTLDLFFAEDLAYAARLSAAEVPCRTEVVEGAFHSFDLFAPKTSVARAFFTSQCDTLREAFAGG